MKWLHLNTGFNTGAYNMEMDLHLAKICPDDEIILRFYHWNPYCISLGANQDFNSIDNNLAAVNNIDVVMRPTGGRAILHAEELTYSVIMPINKNTSVHQIYYEINSALKRGLQNFDKKLEKISLENLQPNFKSIYNTNEGNICFNASAKSELNFEGKKLVGSAQRKFGNRILQHGSILCGEFHKQIIDYLRLPAKEKVRVNIEMDNRTTDLNSILKKKFEMSDLCDPLLKGFEDHFKIKFEEISLNIAETIPE
jgi:lipoyl(octanoyl) transferase